MLGSDQPAPADQDDPYRPASLRNYRILVPLARDACKPMFDRRAADGALGSAGRLVEMCRREFETRAAAVLDAAGVPRAVTSVGWRRDRHRGRATVSPLHLAPALAAGAGGGRGVARDRRRSSGSHRDTRAAADRCGRRRRRLRLDALASRPAQARET